MTPCVLAVPLMRDCGLWRLVGTMVKSGCADLRNSGRARVKIRVGIRVVEWVRVRR